MFDDGGLLITTSQSQRLTEASRVHQRSYSRSEGGSTQQIIIVVIVTVIIAIAVVSIAVAVIIVVI